MNKSDKLDFVVIGAQKCATTWLYDCLKDHPELNLRNSKNEDIYYGSNWMKTNGIEKYFKLFKLDSIHPKGCVSVEYIEDYNSADLLYQQNPTIKIIASLRRPELRAISAYQWYVRKALIPNLSLNEGMNQVLLHYQGKIQNEYSSAYKNIIERGLYAQRLKQWFTKFPQEQIKIQFFDEVQQNPRLAIADIFQFLGINAEFVPPNVSTQPKKNTGFSFLVKLQRKFPHSTLIGKIVDKSNQLFFKNKQILIQEKVADYINLKLTEIYQQPLDELTNLLAFYQPESHQKMIKYWK